MSHQPDEPLDVLRGIWSTSGQTDADLDEACGTQKSCKRMQDVGFDDLVGDDDLRAAWRSRLRREGKLNPGADSIASLVLGPADGRPATRPPAAGSGR